MVENLKTTKYNDGTAIPNVTDNTDWSNLTTPAYCWYDNDISKKLLIVLYIMDMRLTQENYAPQDAFTFRYGVGNTI
jgi:hypothetical protein